MDYTFGERPSEDAEQLFRDALNYRKSYCRHLSSDFDLAGSLADHLARRPDGPRWATQAQRETADMLSLMRDIDRLPASASAGRGGLKLAFGVYQRLRSVRRVAARHKQLFALPQTPHYEIFNDNRYEQHWYSWSDS